MTSLLDTQIMLWWLLGDWRLGEETREILESTPCIVSIASIWEVAIKHRLGKLSIDFTRFRDESVAAGAVLLGIHDEHVIETGRLPGLHEDPFDRLIIAQARIEKLVVISSDARWIGYDIDLRRP